MVLIVGAFYHDPWGFVMETHLSEVGHSKCGSLNIRAIHVWFSPLSLLLYQKLCKEFPAMQ